MIVLQRFSALAGALLAIGSLGRCGFAFSNHFSVLTSIKVAFYGKSETFNFYVTVFDFESH